MSRYCITHANCVCRCQVPWFVETPYGAALFFWGKDVLQHTVYEEECPYRFAYGDFDAIQATLQLYPLHLVRHILPLNIPVKALWDHGRLWGCRQGEALVCRIGEELAP